MRVHRKIKICGNIIGVYDYTQGYSKGFKKTNDLVKLEDGMWYKLNEETGEYEHKKIGRQLQGTTSKEDYLERRKRTLNKDKNRIKDLINSNVYRWKDSKGKVIRPKFMTLTFRENQTNISEANKQFKNFVKRLNYKIKKEASGFEGLQYVNVVEFQKRGAVHYHTLFFNMPYIKQQEIYKLWKLGGVHISGFQDGVERLHKLEFDDNGNCFTDGDNSIKNVGAYITKTMNYMEKSLDDERLQGKKCYSTSTKLLEPVIVEDDGVYKEKEVRLFGDTLTSKNLCFVNVYANEHIGTCLYREYNTKFETNQDMEGMNEVCYNSFIEEYRKLYNY